MKLPETRYANNSGVRIAYQVIGQGPIDLVFVPGFISNLDVHWEDAGFSHLLRRLSTFSRLILFDKRGTGLSDRVDPHHLPDLKTRMDDVRAVMDAAGSGRAAVLGASEGAPMSILFAATYPGRTRALVLYGGYADFHTGVMGPDALARFTRQVETSWGTGASLAHFAPGRVGDQQFQTWWARFERLSVSPTAAIALSSMNAEIDVRPALAGITVPTLVIHRSDDVRVRIAAGRHLAEKIPGARLAELPGRDHPIWTGDVDRVVDEVEEFLTGGHAASERDRILATLLVARLVAPHRLAAQFGDRNWSARLERFQETAAAIISRHGGTSLVSATGEIAARFDAPARAIRCGLALREAAQGLALPLSSGVHAGEIDLRAGGASGLALHIAQRLALEAAVDETLVSGVVCDLVAGSGLHFAARPDLGIDDLDFPLRVHALAPEQHLQPRIRPPATPDLNVLSTREREVLSLIADGLSNVAIAQRLKLSEHTVKRHVANILLKLDLPTRAAAAALIGRKNPA